MAENPAISPDDRAFLAANDFSASALQQHKQREAMDRAEAALAESRKARAALDARIAARDLQKKADAAKATAKTAAAALTGTVTAEQFKASIAKPTMTRAEWQKLDHRERAEWFRNGGKLIDG
jgi:hypothetical protein